LHVALAQKIQKVDPSLQEGVLLIILLTIIILYYIILLLSESKNASSAAEHRNASDNLSAKIVKILNSLKNVLQEGHPLWYSYSWNFRNYYQKTVERDS